MRWRDVLEARLGEAQMAAASLFDTLLAKLTDRD